MSDSYERVQADSRVQLREWLLRNHATSPGIWLVTWKKISGRPHLGYDDIVEEALAFGWVDSQPKAVDAQRSARLLTPRKPGSNWSRLNKERVERLTAAGLMQPAGLAAVAAAQANGRWTALDETETLAEPADLAVALDTEPAARRHWDAISPVRAPRHSGMDRQRPDRRHPASPDRAHRQCRRPQCARQPMAPTETARRDRLR